MAHLFNCNYKSPTKKSLKTKPYKERPQTRLRLTKVACAIFAIVFIIGCAGTSIRPKPDVMKSFNDAPKASHSYFLSGSVNSPEGIIAIDNQYTLASDLWNPVDPGKLQEIVETMHERGTELSSTLHSGLRR